MWPDAECALGLFQRVGTRWLYPAMGGAPQGLRWEAIYPLMDRIVSRDSPEWDELHDSLMVMESAAIQTMREFAPKPAR